LCAGFVRYGLRVSTSVPGVYVESNFRYTQASPWQNGFAERLIGSIRRECVDHFIVFGEAHLRRILQAYAHYYNDI
jgi:transposase InsO family protein